MLLCAQNKNTCTQNSPWNFGNSKGFSSSVCASDTKINVVGCKPRAHDEQSVLERGRQKER